MGLNDINSLSQSLPLRGYKKELQISHSVCAKVSAKRYSIRKRKRQSERYCGNYVRGRECGS